jgi:hypothetical protein
MSRRKKRLTSEIAAFMRSYGRRGRSFDPNDRRYDRKVEEVVKRMDPRELDAIVRAEENADS